MGSDDYSQPPRCEAGLLWRGPLRAEQSRRTAETRGLELRAATGIGYSRGDSRATSAGGGGVIMTPGAS